MSYEAVVGKLLTRLLDSIFRKARMTASRRGDFHCDAGPFSAAPDLDSAKSLVYEARSLWIVPIPELLRAETLLGNAEEWERETRRRSLRRRRLPRRMAARKEVGRKKATRNKVARKKA